MRGALLAAACLCAGSTLAAPVSVRDETGANVTLAQPARRVISLAPHLTELAFAAGGGAALVGVGRYSDYPAEARKLAQVGDAFALNLEAIAALKPDLVLLWSSGTNERAKAQLRALRIPVYENEIRSVEGIATTLRALGTLMGSEAAAGAAAQRLQSDWRAIEAQYAGRAPVRVFYQLWHEPLMTLNGEHLISRAISACGGVNVFATLPTLTSTVSWEAAVKADPQLIATAGAQADDAHLEGWQRFGSRVSAVRDGRYALLPGELIARMGPRFVQGTLQLCEAIDRAR
jgi:iron complex transport system substrate-binding protein